MEWDVSVFGGGGKGRQVDREAGRQVGEQGGEQVDSTRGRVDREREPQPTSLPAPTPPPVTSPVGLLPPPSDPSWGTPPLPSWATQFRRQQEVAIRRVVSEFERGKKYVFLDAPTGAGKTLIAEAIRRKIGGRAIYTCTTKSLQDQFVRDYPYAKVLKGRANYPTLDFPDQFSPGNWRSVSCEDCNYDADTGCDFCADRMGCPYQVAKMQAVRSELAVVNTAYALAEMSGSRSAFADRELMILDECDLLEGAIMGFAEVRISPRAQKKYGIVPPEKKTVAKSWKEWVEWTLPKVRNILANIDVKAKPKEARRLKGLVYSLGLLADGLADPDNPEWVYDYDTRRATDDQAIVFKPVKVDGIASDVLWDRAERFLLMSASIISVDEMCESLGVNKDDAALVVVPSTFPPSNRPVHVMPVARVVRKEYDRAVVKVAKAVYDIMVAHPDERILVHTVSYRMAADLRDRLPTSRVVVYQDGAGREGALARYKGQFNAVILAPSLDRGIDLPDDLCRVQVVCKVPYPFMGDKQVMARLHSRGGQLWFDVQSIRTLVQMTGRGVRHATDTATTYILDQTFVDLYRKRQRFFPAWWREALDFTGSARRRLVG